MKIKILSTCMIFMLVGLSVVYFVKNNNELNTHLKIIKDHKDRPDLAAMQDFEMTKDLSLGYPPVNRKLSAHEQAKQILAKRSNKNATAISGVEWVERGPNNVAGRTRAILFDPNDVEAKRVFAGGIGGGLWTNQDITDENSLWAPVNDFMANIAISSIAFDPNVTTTFYLGTGLGYTGDIRGVGIFKSTDGGATWDLLSSTNNEDFQAVQKIIVTNSGAVLASARNFNSSSEAESGGIWRSTDAGATWSKVVERRGGDLELASDGTIYATTGFGAQAGKIFKSDDDGINWSEISPEGSANRIELAVSESSPEVIYAVADGGSGSTDVAYFKKSIDAGESWNDISIPLYYEQDCGNRTNHFTRGQAFFDLILGVDPEDPDVVIAGGIDLHRTTDGGNNWELISYWTGACDVLVHADQHTMVYRPGKTNEWIFGNDGGVFYSPNAGNSVDPDIYARNNGFNVTTFYSCAAKNEIGSNYFLAGAQDNGTQQFSKIGINNTREVTGGDGAFCFIDQDNPDLQITSFVFNSYRLSLDGGLTFNSISSDQSRGRFINPADYDDATNILYAAGNSGEIVRYSNLQGTIDIDNLSISGINGTVSHIRVSQNTTDRLIVGTGNGGVYIVDDASNTPDAVEITGDLPSGFISCIEIGADDDHLLVTYSNYGVVSVWETIDGGATWNNKEGNLPDMPVRWALYNPNNLNEVLLATEVGVWSTTDISVNSPDWEPTNEGLANVRCDMLQIRESDDMVVVATYGRGLFTTNIFVNEVLADFEVNKTVTYVGKEIQFTNGSQNASSWSWDFGDTNTSSLEDPTHAYNSPGVYSVTLEINAGASSKIKTDLITVLPNKVSPYTLAEGGDFETNQTDFASMNLFGDYNLWEVGTPTGALDTPNSGSNVWKTNLNDSVFAADYVCALFSPAFDLSDINKDYSIKFKKSMDATGNSGPFAVQMQYSTDGGDNWFTLGRFEKVFGDDRGLNWYNKNPKFSGAIFSPIFQNQQGWIGNFVNEETEYNVSHLAGNSQVAFRFVLSVVQNFNSGYDDGFMIDDFELIETAPRPIFNANKTVTYIDEPINFNLISANPGTILWDFGDGSSSTELFPVKSFSTPGKYTITLTVDGSTETKTDFIHVLPSYSVPYELEDGGDFETNQNDFAAVNNFGTPFELGSSDITNKNGTSSGNFAWVTGITEDNYQSNSEAFLYTPLFDFSSVGAYTIEFNAKYAFELDWEGMVVEYTEDQGNTWKRLGTETQSGWYNRTAISDNNNGFAAIAFAPGSPIFSGNTSNQFENKNLDISFLGGKTNVGFRFVFRTDPATEEEGIAIDDFQLIGPEPGPAVPDFALTGFTGCDGQIVTFTNMSTGSISSLEWDFGANATPQMASGTGPHVVTYNSTVATSNTVVLTVESPVNGTQVEEKLDLITVAPLHTPSFNISYNSNGQAVLTASDGDFFQWYVDGELIDGANDQIYLTNEFKKNYSVDVGVDGCVRPTNRQFVISGLDDDFIKSLTLYPNPSNKGEVNLQIENDFIGEMTIDIYNTIGHKKETVIISKNNNKLTTTLRMKDFDSGMYYVIIRMDNDTIRRQIILN